MSSRFIFPIFVSGGAAHKASIMKNQHQSVGAKLLTTLVLSSTWERPIELTPVD